MQQSSVLFCALLLTISAAQLSCPSYQCKPPGVQMANNTCTVTSSGNVFVQPCDSNSGNSFCNVNTGKCTAPPSSPVQSYPGEPCTVQSNCVIGTCTQGVCVGLPIGTHCTNSNQCSPGLYCATTGQCSLQKPVGSTCGSDFDCVSYAGCVSNNCTAYYSLAVNSTVPDCSTTGTSNFCAKIACQRTSWIGSVGICLNPPKSYNFNPNRCSSNLNCTSTDGVHNYTGVCSCGYNADGQGYCQPVLGDTQGLWLIQAYKNAVRKSNGLCNTARRMAQGCWQAIGSWENVKTQYWGFYYLPLIQGNDRCVAETFTQVYWSDAGVRLTLGLLLLAGYFS